MKTRLNFCFIAIILSLFALTACDKDESKDRREIIQMTIASEMGKGLGNMDGYDENADCIFAKEGDNEEWIKLSPLSITGFRYEEGYEYSLKVDKIYLGNPPQDASSIRYELIEILSKIKTNSSM